MIYEETRYLVDKPPATSDEQEHLLQQAQDIFFTRLKKLEKNKLEKPDIYTEERVLLAIQVALQAAMHHLATADLYNPENGYNFEKYNARCLQLKELDLLDPTIAELGINPDTWQKLLQNASVLMNYEIEPRAEFVTSILKQGQKLDFSSESNFIEEAWQITSRDSSKQALKSREKLPIKIVEEGALPSIGPASPEEIKKVASQVLPPAFLEKLAQFSLYAHDSQHVLLLADTFGIGDQAVALRFAKAVSTILGKPVECVVSTLGKQLVESDQSCQFVLQPSEEMLAAEDLTMISLKGTSDDINSHIFFQKNPDLRDRLIATNRIFSSDHRIYRPVYNRWLEEKGLSPKESKYSSSDLVTLVGLQLIDIPVKPEDLTNSVYEWVTRDLRSQDIDLVIVPDAKEGSDPSECLLAIDDDQTLYRQSSLKSLPISYYQTVFEKLPADGVDHKVVIVLGVSHPEYCQRVITLAHQSAPPNWEIEVFQDSLHAFAQLVSRTHSFFGMDSGTTHIANQVAVECAEKDRQINVLEIFNDKWDFQQYGIRALPSEQSRILLPRYESGVMDRLKWLKPEEVSKFINQFL